MEFFRRFFKKSSSSSDPEITFGRFNDSYKTEEQFELWNELTTYFEKGRYLKLYKSIFTFLQNSSGKNIALHETKGEIQFTIFQGSRQISGICDIHGFRAESVIATAQVLPLGLMRGLLEKNFDLKFCRYALDQKNRFCLIFDTFAADGPPHKLYQGLRELAIEADRQDDMLMKEFPELQKLTEQSYTPVSEDEMDIKYHFMKKWASETMKEIDNSILNAYKFPGSISFVLLDFIYKFDFLIRPEGILKEEILDLDQMYFETNGITVFEKNNRILKWVRSIENIEKENFFATLYEVNNTFGIAEPEGHEKFIEITDAHLNELQWYFDNHHFYHVKAIVGYIIGFSLFQYALPAPTKALLLLYFQIVENDYFRKLGFKKTFKSGKIIQLNQVKKEVNLILSSFRGEFGKIISDTSILEDSSEASFAKSYLIMIRNLNYIDEFV